MAIRRAAEREKKRKLRKIWYNASPAPRGAGDVFCGWFLQIGALRCLYFQRSRIVWPFYWTLFLRKVYISRKSLCTFKQVLYWTRDRRYSCISGRRTMTILRILLLAAIIIAVNVLITAVPLSIWVRRNGCKTATKVYFLKSNVSSGETFQYVLSALRRIDCI